MGSLFVPLKDYVHTHRVMLLLRLHEVFTLNETSAVTSVVFILPNSIDTVPYISHVLEVVCQYLYP